MPFLIDGHNLIGQMAQLQLSDPEDELKLIMLLGRFALRRKRRLVVVFDRGVYGRTIPASHGVSVRFARSPGDADALIIKQLRRFVSPQEWVLVSSDRALIAVAEDVGCRVVQAHEFAAMLEAMDAPSPYDTERAAAHAHVPGDKVAEWLDLFGVDAQTAEKPVNLQQNPQTARPSGPAHPPPSPVNPMPREADGRARRSRGGPQPYSSEGQPLHKPPPPVHPDELEEWLRFFGAEDELD